MIFSQKILPDFLTFIALNRYLLVWGREGSLHFIQKNNFSYNVQKKDIWSAFHDKAQPSKKQKKKIKET